MLSIGAAAAKLGVGPAGEAEAGSRSSPSTASPPIAFPPLLSVSAAAARSPGDRLHFAVAQLLVRRRSRPEHERLSAPPRAAASRVSHPHELLRRGLRACRCGSPPHELPSASSTSTVDSSGRGEIPWRASPSLSDEKTPSWRTPIASPPVADASMASPGLRLPPGTTGRRYPPPATPAYRRNAGGVWSGCGRREWIRSCGHFVRSRRDPARTFAKDDVAALCSAIRTGKNGRRWSSSDEKPDS